MQLSQIDLFSGFDAQELAFLETITQKCHYAKGSILFYAGEKARSLLVLSKGSVEIYKHDTEGNEILMGTFHPHELVAEMALFESIPYPATARAVEDVTLLQIDFEAFLAHLLKSPKLILPIIHSLTRKINHLEGVLRYALIDDAPRRLARYLTDHEKHIASTTQRQIAQKLKLTPESVSRILKNFKERGWVEVKLKKLHITDMKGLREFSE